MYMVELFTTYVDPGLFIIHSDLFLEALNKYFDTVWLSSLYSSETEFGICGMEGIAFLHHKGFKY